MTPSSPPPGGSVHELLPYRDDATFLAGVLPHVCEGVARGDHVVVAECRLHELLLATAFADGPPWRLLCPYDQVHLPRDVRTGALRSHPFVATPTGRRPSTAFSRDAAAARRTVGSFARSGGLSPGQYEALELAAAELATNSVHHGGGSGSLAMWRTDEAAVVEFSDSGRLRESLVGRLPPEVDRHGGRGLYLVNQLCDLVQVRSGSWGTTVRVTTWR